MHCIQRKSYARFKNRIKLSEQLRKKHSGMQQRRTGTGRRDLARPNMSLFKSIVIVSQGRRHKGRGQQHQAAEQSICRLLWNYGRIIQLNLFKVLSE